MNTADWKNKLAQVQPRNEEAAQQASRHVNQLTKPLGSLGRLESLAVELAAMTGEPFPAVTPPGVLVFAADHGVAAEGVSAYPQEVTAQMVANFAHGGAAINVFSRQIGALLHVVDVGVAVDVDAPGVWTKKVRPGTASFLRERAMTREEAELCVQIGFESAEAIIDEGAKLLIVGEMGIGNTTASSALLAALTGAEPDELVGRGTGVSDEKWQKKKAVVKEALSLHQPDAGDPLDALSKVGGLEIGSMAGAILCAASRRVPVLLDGFISTVAALLAVRLCPVSAEYLLGGHRSQEPGHAFALQTLGKEPLVDLGLRLGEGSGAAVAFPIVEAATRMLREMATFDEAGVSSE
ncbi:nicotinate-nucleotide--dimethylbenzimidazole phosphoribosyltransferase [Brevibacillus borstelensis]|uniref:nicotinate-nucleotide--dimethylbenzimidazole phosphoribosyltransferase n=1 Tax=Brevibacillus borstelensis TaxID=45462 RepID=UPI00148FDAF3|nr:nicotinate-nucleotide--dimethylbenzimidazole phosphoribosyltransferase [Brevibacillus borstelensis]MCC0563629.1 nicotinate-nucleotide--dimethylbenzimidazole phosphoribosyltransferase [Brevibacillus borstelensis]MCM3469273.1 nicotinate-nucleotide--dimethylbenzimidazole phosphoribosyltransferase [Brevibacillus borstelensis]MCM3558779.1 nicotinate-nucleotide--dimethylbenzimidazole phosphoribosyltransferase [Brevibacillus borstelensis]MCM3592005.1 nicotinate-nucleotide--dimethylbenzimidazole pho